MPGRVVTQWDKDDISDVRPDQDRPPRSAHALPYSRGRQPNQRKPRNKPEPGRHPAGRSPASATCCTGAIPWASSRWRFQSPAGRPSPAPGPGPSRTWWPKWPSSGPAPSRATPVHPYLNRRQRKGKGELPPPQPGAGPQRNPGRHHLPGTGDPGGHGYRRIQPRPGRFAAPGDEPQAIERGHGAAERRILEGARRIGIDEKVAGPPSSRHRQLCGVRLLQGPCGSPGRDYLSLCLAEALLSRRILLRPAELPAHGLLFPRGHRQSSQA